MENQVRVFRKNPIAWWDKNVMRYLRTKYGHDKKIFLLIRSVYLALCEIESDFTNKPINFFTKSVGTYAGMSRETAGKYINLLIKEGLIKRFQNKDPVNNTFTSGTLVEIMGLENVDKSTMEPLSGYPDNGASQHRDKPAAIKNINKIKKLNIIVNEDNNQNSEHKTFTIKDLLGQYGLKPVVKPDVNDEVLEKEYIANEMAEKLGDPKGLGCYRKIAARLPLNVIFEILASVKDTANSGNIRHSKGALFVEIVKRYASDKGIDLGFNKKGIQKTALVRRLDE